MHLNTDKHSATNNTEIDIAAIPRFSYVSTVATSGTAGTIRAEKLSPPGKPG